MNFKLKTKKLCALHLKNYYKYNDFFCEICINFERINPVFAYDHHICNKVKYYYVFVIYYNLPTNKILFL